MITKTHRAVTALALMTFAFSANAQASETTVAQAASSAIPDVKPPAIDPRSLLGKCQGNWFEKGSGITAYFDFTEATEGGISGQLYISNPRITGPRGNMNKPLPFTGGKLNGEQLKFVAEGDVEVTLDLSGGAFREEPGRGLGRMEVSAK